MNTVKRVAFVMLVVTLFAVQQTTLYACDELCGEDSGVCGWVGVVFEFENTDYESFCQESISLVCGSSGYCDSWGGPGQGECQNIGGCTSGGGLSICLNQNIVCRCHYSIPCMQ